MITNKFINRLSIFFIIFIIVLLTFSTNVFFAAEAPEKIFSGNSSVSKLYNRINYPDLKTSKSFAKAAIYETSALGLFKLQEGVLFKGTTKLTKEQAIAMVLTAAGLENTAISTANKLYNASSPKLSSKDALKAIYDGFLSVAAGAKIITATDLNDALSNAKRGFVRSAYVTRQEVAFWLGTALKLNINSGITNIYMNYKDWRNINPDKISMVEAILENNIMNGDEKGYFNPNSPITMEQMAQIIKNAEESIYPINSIVKYSGTVEKVTINQAQKTGSTLKTVTFMIRNSEGGLHELITEGKLTVSTAKKNEVNKTMLPLADKDFYVYKNGQFITSSSIKEGDRIEYYVKSDKTILYAINISNVFDTSYLVGMVNNLVLSNNSIILTPVIRLSYPNVDIGTTLADFSAEENKNTEKYIYSKNVILTANSKKIAPKDLAYGQFYLFTINGNLITSGEELELAEAGVSGIYNGINDECNEALGYISLYLPSKSNSSQTYTLNTFQLDEPSDIDVIRNGITSTLGEIESGDTIFFRVGENKKVNAISAVSNYTTIFGKIIQKKTSSIRIQDEKGRNIVIPINGKEIVMSGNSNIGYKSIVDSDYVKIILNDKSNNPSIKLISVQHVFYNINNILKGQMSYYDPRLKAIMITGTEELINGSWERSDSKGVLKLNVADNCSFFDENGKTIIGGATAISENKTLYIAMRGDFGKEIFAETISIADDRNPELTIRDSISNISDDGSITMPSSDNQIEISEGTIIVNNGRLVYQNSLTTVENAVVIASKNTIDGKVRANIINVYPYNPFGSLSVYRGHIKSIKVNQEFTLDSYSKLEGESWNYANTPITFTLDKNIKIADEKDMLNNRDFVPYGSNNFLDKYVYVVTNGVNAQLVSTAPYGAYAFEGQIYDVIGGEVEADGGIVSQPNQIKLYNTKNYDITKQVWNDSKELDLKLLNNTILIKDGNIIDPIKLKKGDRIRVYKKDDTTSGDVYIAVVK